MAQWTWPICEDCWTKQNPGRVPTVFIHGPWELCGWCGKETTAGIYVRCDPAEVPFTRGVVK